MRARRQVTARRGTPVYARDPITRAPTNQTEQDVAEMIGVREYAEGYAVYLHDVFEIADQPGRLAITAYNEATHDSTQVDLVDVLEWLAEHRPELLVAALDARKAATEGERLPATPPTPDT